MKAIERTVDVIQGLSTEPIGRAMSFPIYMGCTQLDTKHDLYSELSWEICPDNGVIQLKKLIPLDVLYSNNQHSGAVGNTWMEHHESFASFIAESAPQSILEIGGAHGILSKLYMKNYSISDWCIVEPDPKPVEGVMASFIKGFFDSKIPIPFPVDTVVHSHVFEHIYEPSLFLSNINAILPEGGRLVFSVPNMESMLSKKYTNCINFEHTVYLSEPYIGYLLAKHGFLVENKSYFKDDHSIFYACVKSNVIVPLPTLGQDLYERNKKTYLQYEQYHLDLITELNNVMPQISHGRKVYLFGAHVFSQYLICSGLHTERIDSILDNDENKHGKRLYGTSLQVRPPNEIAHDKDPIIILRAGAYNTEIKDDILLNINPSAVFL